jgi:hypothetical protein
MIKFRFLKIIRSRRCAGFSGQIILPEFKKLF